MCFQSKGAGIFRRLYWPTGIGGCLDSLGLTSHAADYAPELQYTTRRCRLTFPIVTKLTAELGRHGLRIRTWRTRPTSIGLSTLALAFLPKRLTASRTHAPAPLVGHDEGRSRVQRRESSGWRIAITVLLAVLPPDGSRTAKIRERLVRRRLEIWQPIYSTGGSPRSCDARNSGIAADRCLKTYRAMPRTADYVNTMPSS
jgi:hypothetical protein